MDDTSIKGFVLFLLIRIVASERTGFVSEVFVDKKFDCPSASRRVYTVKSEIQCTHLCLQNDNCELLNYNIKKEIDDNCEVFSQSSGCSTKLGKQNWKAMRFQVCISFILSKFSAFSNVPLKEELQDGTCRCGASHSTS